MMLDSRDERLLNCMRSPDFREQLFVECQPQYQFPDVGLYGFELLVRWRHPLLGLVNPNVFIPLSERDPAIIKLIGEYVLERGLHYYSIWEKQWPGLVLSVNVSWRQLVDSSHVRRLILALIEKGLPRGAICLEITETVHVIASDAILESLNMLRAAGCGLAIDDFGVGYSNLTSLDFIPADCIKLDRAFVEKIGFAGYDPVIARAVIAIAKDLGIKAVAEGVENTGQFQALRYIGYEYFQGFLFAGPIAIDSVERMLKNLASNDWASTSSESIGMSPSGSN